MDKDKRTASFPVKPLLFACALTFATIFLFLAAFSVVLINLDRFERFYPLCCWGVVLLEAAILALISRKVPFHTGAFAVTVSLICALIFFVVSLILSGGKFNYLQIGSCLAVYVIASFLFAILPVKSTGRKNKKFRP